MSKYPKDHKYYYNNYYHNRDIYQQYYHYQCYPYLYNPYNYRTLPLPYRQNPNAVPQGIAPTTSRARPYDKTKISQSDRLTPESESVTLQQYFYASRETIKSNLAPTESGFPELNYHLEVVQQPVRARMCGFGEKDRRPLSPLPFVRLRLSNDDGPVNCRKIDHGFFTLQATIHDHSTDKEVSLVIHPTSTQEHQIYYENLVGEKNASGKRLISTDGKEDIWFIFRDLSVRTEGRFYLKFTLVNIGWQGFVNTNSIPIKVIDTVNSEPFTVFTAKKFPGMIEITSLSQCFLKQGNRIPTRRDRKFQEEDESI